MTRNKLLVWALLVAACEPGASESEREAAARARIDEICESPQALLFGMNIDPPNGRSNPSAEELHDLGVRWVRFAYKWHASFDYVGYVQRLRARNVKVLLVINYESLPDSPTATSARSEWDRYVPRFVATAEELARVFRDGVDAYEIWNEPDGSRGLASEVPADVFGPMARQAADAMRPHINGRWIVVGGLVTFGAADWFRTVNRTGDLNGFEVVGLHPYGASWKSESYEDSLDRAYRTLHSAVARPIWITELGASDHSTGEEPNPYNVALYMENKVYGFTRDNWLEQVHTVFWFAWSDTNEKWFGITDEHGRYKDHLAATYRRLSPARGSICDRPVAEDEPDGDEYFARMELCGYPDFSDVDGRCVPSCGMAGGDTCDTDATSYCDGYGLLEAYDCRQCCLRAGGPIEEPVYEEPPRAEEPPAEEPPAEEPPPEEPPPEEPPAEVPPPWSEPSGCPCGGVDNFCAHPPGTDGCEMTWGGGYCDPNGDGSYDDGDWERGWADYHAQCG